VVGEIPQKAPWRGDTRTFWPRSMPRRLKSGIYSTFAHEKGCYAEIFPHIHMLDGIMIIKFIDHEQELSIDYYKNGSVVDNEI
jgi:hypothetical protein